MVDDGGRNQTTQGLVDHGEDFSPDIKAGGSCIWTRK